MYFFDFSFSLNKKKFVPDQYPKTYINSYLYFIISLEYRENVRSQPQKKQPKINEKKVL